MDVLSDLAVISIHSVNRIYTEKGSGGVRESRPCWAAVMKYEGETVYNYAGKEYISNSKRLAILPKGCSYKWECTESGHFIIIEFDGNAEYDRLFSIPIHSRDKILNEFQKAERCMTLKETAYRLRTAELVNRILYMLVTERARQYVPGSKQKKILAAAEYMRENYNRELSNNALAEISGCSTVYFRKLFTEVCGASPISYLHTLRTEKAKELLCSDCGSVGAVALAVGYKNIYDFSRAFKRRTGMSPTEFVKKAEEH